MKANRITDLIEKKAPLSLQEPWDNSGWQIKLKDDFRKVLIAIEIRSDVISEAETRGCDLIITHHPLIFGDGVRQVDDNNVTGNQIIELIRAGISVYSSHTPYDKCEDGNNDYLGRVLGFDKFISLNAKYGSQDDPEYREAEDFYTDTGALDYVRVGYLNKAESIRDFMRRAASRLDVDSKYFRYAGDLDVQIRKAAWCTGSGSEFMEAAYYEDCDIYITGDLKYHDAQKARELGINVLDLGHWGTEKIFVSNMTSDLIDLEDEDLELIKSDLDLNPFAF